MTLGLSFYSLFGDSLRPRWILLSLPKYIGKIKGIFLDLHYDFLDMCECWLVVSVHIQKAPIMQIILHYGGFLDRIGVMFTWL